MANGDTFQIDPQDPSTFLNFDPGTGGMTQATGGPFLSGDLSQQMFLDTTTGQVVTGAQAQQSDPNGFHNSLNALRASANQANPNVQPRGGFNAANIGGLLGVAGGLGG